MKEAMKAQANDNERLWDVHEAARFLRVSASWIYHRTAAGLLPHLKIDGMVRFEPWTLREFTQHDRVSSTTVKARLATR